MFCHLLTIDHGLWELDSQQDNQDERSNTTWDHFDYLFTPQMHKGVEIGFGALVQIEKGKCLTGRDVRVGWTHGRWTQLMKWGMLQQCNAADIPDHPTDEFGLQRHERMAGRKAVTEANGGDSPNCVSPLEFALIRVPGSSGRQCGSGGIQEPY